MFQDLIKKKPLSQDQDHRKARALPSCSVTKRAEQSANRKPSEKSPTTAQKLTNP